MDVAHCYLDGNPDVVEFCAHDSFHRVLAASTYTLQEGDRPSRTGSVSLFNVNADVGCLELLHRVDTSGVFDMKWNPVSGSVRPLLAQADADGYLRLHRLESSADGSEVHGNGLKEINGEKVSSSMCLCLCLCLDWNPAATSFSVGLSDGSISIVSLRESQTTVIQEWKAHEFEVWATCFDIHQPELVYTGSDDCRFCCWDLRSDPSELAFQNTKVHGMGVCCIAKSPSDPHTLLTGSYDEHLRVEINLKAYGNGFEETFMVVLGFCGFMHESSLLRCWMIAYLQNVMLEKFLTRDCRMEIIHSRCARTDQLELDALAISGVLVKSPSFIPYTVAPTAYVTAATSFTSAPNVSVTISFSESCAGGGGFRCASANACNLLVYGSGQVLPSTLNILQPNLKYTLTVHVSSSAQYGRLVLVMDKNFCTDAAGNKFIRTEKSSFFVHFDRRNVFVNLRTHIPERLLQLNSETRTVQATSKYKNLKVYLYFTKPTLNSSTEILNSVHTSQGSLVPIGGDTLQNRRFGFQVENISTMAIVTVSLDSNSVVSRLGTLVSPVAPVTFLYDSQKPAVRLTTTSKMRTRHSMIPIFIKFMKPVFGFNSSHISLTGGHLQRSVHLTHEIHAQHCLFHEVSKRTYTVEIQADDDFISINIPENITEDVAGNKNLASNILQVRHYAVPVMSLVLSSFATAAFVVTASVAGLLTVSTASLLAVGAFSRRSSPLVSDPARILFRMACHIQIFALSRRLAVPLPVEYSEFARGLQWSIPSLSLPWETGHIHPVKTNPYSYGSKVHDSGIFETLQPQKENMDMVASVYGLPLSPMEYRSYFESQNIKPEADSILDPNYSNGWRDFYGSMFWLAVIGGSLILLHFLFRVILSFRKRKPENQKSYGALVFPRFEIFLVVLALPCVCNVSAALVRGGASSGVIVGILLLGVVTFLLLSLLLFLSIGITFGKLLQYKEVHQEGQRFHWYQEIVRVTLGPGKKGQWTWKKQFDSVHLTMLGPLFEDLRGPPKYMLSQISGQTLQKHSDRIIDSDDETEDAEAPFIQKLFGILRIYYTLLETMRRVSIGILAGAYSGSTSSTTPIIILLCITSFQLFFMVLKKPFIKKRVQLVEIVSVSSEVGIFATSLVLLEKEFSAGDKKKIGIFMLSLFLLTFLAQMINEWYSLYRQTKQLDPAKGSFLFGLKTALIGFLLFFIPRNFIKNLDSSFPMNNRTDGEAGDVASSGDRNRSSGSRSSGSMDKPWLKQLREIAKASFTKEGTGDQNDPSTSSGPWSGFWRGKKSGSSSLTSSSDFKSKPKGLYKDLEAIFASK
ncbi:hypothetical protein RJ639_034054 [Escallonia herrerae]|uniref:Uncharacterized protein n=1 Tax=Escallonia herrerae TaxID=1293975 RepID=A0AA88WW79_9ASTE|nr:hypothetical protein RJ639_034054 [Escallonia herrerae]